MCIVISQFKDSVDNNAYLSSCKLPIIIPYNIQKNAVL